MQAAKAKPKKKGLNEAAKMKFKKHYTEIDAIKMLFPDELKARYSKLASDLGREKIAVHWQAEKELLADLTDEQKALVEEKVEELNSGKVLDKETQLA